MTGPKVLVSQYLVFGLPEDDPLASLYVASIDYLGDGQWCVRAGSQMLTAAGEWRTGSAPARKDRFDEETAKALAVKHVPEYRVGGRTLAEAIEWRDRREAARREQA